MSLTRKHLRRRGPGLAAPGTRLAGRGAGHEQVRGDGPDAEVLREGDDGLPAMARNATLSPAVGLAPVDAQGVRHAAGAAQGVDNGCVVHGGHGIGLSAARQAAQTAADARDALPHIASYA